MPSQITPESLRDWLKGNGTSVRDVGDFICCLPAKFRGSNFVIMHSSVAGQDGTPECPRLILHDGTGDTSVYLGNEMKKSTNTMAFSVNGGAPNMRQKDSVEAMNYQGIAGTFDLYDIKARLGEVAMSEPNPKACLVCHGEASKIPKHGVLTLFDRFPHWPRAVGGAMKCNPEEDQLQFLKSKRALEAVRDNLRFACLDRSKVIEDLKNLERNKTNKSIRIFENQNGGLTKFDSLVGGINMQRVVRTVIDTPDYQAYKYILTAEDLCGDDVLKNLDQWMPTSVIAKHRDISFVRHENSEIKTNDDLKQRRAQLQAEALRLRQEQKAQARVPSKVFSEQLEPGHSVYSCENKESQAFVQKQQVAALKITNPTLKSYTLDKALEAPPFERGEPVSAFERFIFEGRGISISNWSQEMGKGQYREIGNLSGMLQFEDLPSSELRQILKPLHELESTKYSPKQMDEVKKRVCEKLRSASFNALTNIPAASNYEKPAPASGLQ